jgi:hypothetical protein
LRNGLSFPLQKGEELYMQFVHINSSYSKIICVCDCLPGVCCCKKMSAPLVNRYIILSIKHPQALSLIYLRSISYSLTVGQPQPLNSFITQSISPLRNLSFSLVFNPQSIHHSCSLGLVPSRNDQW